MSKGRMSQDIAAVNARLSRQSSQVTVFRSDRLHVQYAADTDVFWVSHLRDGNVVATRQPLPTELMLIEAIQALSRAQAKAT